MPGMNGIEVIRRCKEVSPETEAIVLTGKESLTTAVAAMRYGACDYLTKPCRLAELRDLLSTIAQRRDMVKKYYLHKLQPRARTRWCTVGWRAPAHSTSSQTGYEGGTNQFHRSHSR